MNRVSTALLLALATLAAAPAARACCCPGDACPACPSGWGLLVNGATTVAEILTGYCNIFGCHCDYCPGASACVPIGRRRLEAVAVAPNTPSIRECEDIASILNEGPALNAVRLTRVFCKEANATVGLAFAQAAIDILDSDMDGNVTCPEWFIAKGQASVANLPGGGYFGRKDLPLPACAMSDTGKQKWASINSHLAQLRAATLVNAKTNATIASKLATATVQDVKNVPLDAARLAIDKANATVARVKAAPNSAATLAGIKKGTVVNVTNTLTG